MKDKIRVEFEMKQMMCNGCKKSSSEYYELKLQLRFTYFEDVNIIREEIVNLLNKNFNTINKVEELDVGCDIYFASLGEINRISKLFNKKYFTEEKRSRKIVGYNFLESKDIWRHTILINIINLEVGDEVSIKGENYYIKAFNKNELVLRDLIYGAKKVVNYSIVKDYLKLLNKKNSVK